MLNLCSSIYLFFISKRETGYVASSEDKDNNALFSLQYVQFQLPAVLVDMTVENNILAAVLDNFRILRIDLDNPLEVDGKFQDDKCYKWKGELMIIV